MGLFSKAFSPKKPIQRRSASLNNLVAMDPTIRQREFNPDPATPSKFNVGGATIQIHDGQVITEGGSGQGGAQLKKENEQLKQEINKLRLEKELLLDMLAEVTADYKIQAQGGH